MATGRHVGVVVMVLGLLAAASMAAARTWTSANGKFTIEATLADFKDGQVTLKKDDGGQITVPLSKFSAKDREFVKKQFPQAGEESPQAKNGFRVWKSGNGKFTVRAKMVDFSQGKVRLEKADGKEIVVPFEKLGPKDRAWVKAEMRRQGKPEPEDQPDEGTEPESKDEEPVAEKLGLQTVQMKPVSLKLGKGRRKPDALTRYMLGVTGPQSFFVQLDRGKSPYEARFSRLVEKEPKYEVAKPFRAVARFGSEDYAFALDATGKAPKGYNTLYFDANRNGDLTDDKWALATDVAGDPAKGTSSSQFSQIHVPLTIDGDEIKHTFMLSVVCGRIGPVDYARALLRSTVIREGQIQQGGRKIRLVLVDQNSNGRFDDRVSVRKAGSRLSVSMGDFLLVNPNTRSRTGGPTLGRDQYFVSKTICVGGHFYKMEVTPSGDQVKLEPAEFAMGYVTNASPMYRATVYNDDYGVVMIGGTKGQKIPLPEGEWKVADYTLTAGGPAQGTFVSAAFSGDAPSVVVDKEKTVALVFGTPFQPVVTIQDARSKKGGLSLAMVGQGGERCTNCKIKGKNPPKPVFEVRDKEGKVVYTGKFEWG
ncbi:MAG: hypothetical protein JW888_11905 [Pirellulales bacterium]|nr:hypothetical protein [Pirellulales bacterium]